MTNTQAIKAALISQIIESNTTPMQELLHYIQNSNALTFLPEQLSSVIEKKYLPLEKSTITNAFDAGESNIWNSKRDEGFDFEGGADYYKQTFTNNNEQHTSN